MSIKHTWKYVNYMRSKEWREFRRGILQERGARCERCGWDFEESKLELHHRTYERLGAERSEDVELLCHPCHEKADKERAVEGAHRSANALYWARVDGFARTKYGEDGDYPDDVSEEFDAWTERRGYD
jgi:phage terminase large subunit GpA-like protein